MKERGERKILIYEHWTEKCVRLISVILYNSLYNCFVIVAIGSECRCFRKKVEHFHFYKLVKMSCDEEATVDEIDVSKIE